MHQTEGRIGRIDRFEQRLLREERGRYVQKPRRLDDEDCTAGFDPDDVEVGRRLKPRRKAAAGSAPSLDALTQCTARGIDQHVGDFAENAAGDSRAPRLLTREPDCVSLLDGLLLCPPSLPRRMVPRRFRPACS